MADRYEFNLHAPHPNVDIDAMRRIGLQVLAGVDDAYWLTGLLSQLLDEVLAANADAAAERQQLRDEVQALTAQVTALEAHLPAPPTTEVP